MRSRTKQFEAMTPAPRTPDQASDAAVEAAKQVADREFCEIYDDDRAQVRHVLAAAHDPALGDQRSVCIADVLEFLRDDTTATPPEWLRAADAINDEFGGRDE